MSANVNGRVATDWVPGAGATATGIAHTEQCINTFAFPFSGRKEPHFAAFLWIFSGFLSTVSVGLKMHDYDYVGSGHFRTEMYIFNSRTINILLFSFVFRHMIFDWLSGIFGEFGVGKPPCSTCAMLSIGERERVFWTRRDQSACCVRFSIIAETMKKCAKIISIRSVEIRAKLSHFSITIARSF